MQRQVATLAIVALLACFGSRHVFAHAGPRLTDPLEGATLGDTPTIVRLSFSEKPEASLSLIRVLDVGGTAYQVGSPQPVPGDPLALSVPVKPLARGIYIAPSQFEALMPSLAHTPGQVEQTATAAAEFGG